MSWPVVNLVNSRQYRGPARRLLSVLAQHADVNGGSIFPSIPTLAQEAGVADRTVQRDFQLLIRDGLVELVGQRSCSNGYTNVWQLKLEALHALPPIKQDGDPRHDVTPRMARCHPSPDTLSPDPRQNGAQPYQGTIDDIDGVAVTREADLDLSELEAVCRQWAKGSLNLASPLGRDLDPIIRLMRPPDGTGPCTFEDVRQGMTDAADSLLRRGQKANSLKYYQQPIRQARDRRLAKQTSMENTNARTDNDPLYGALDAEGNRNRGPRRQHGADGMLAAALWFREHAEVR